MPPIPHQWRAELAQHEQVIERGKQTFVEVGAALLEIRERRGYVLAGYATFEQYHKERWNLGRTYAFYLIESAQVVKNLDVLNCERLPMTESQARPLTQLEPEAQRGSGRRKCRNVYTFRAKDTAI